MKERIKRVALEREKMRAEELSRLRGGGAVEGRTSVRREDTSRTYMRNIVDKFSLQKAFQNEGTIDALARAGYRGQGPLTTFLFMRFATPLALFIVTITYL